MSIDKKPVEKLNVPQRIAYGMGNMGGNFLNLIFMQWLYPRYCPESGDAVVPIMWLTYAILAGRIVDAVSDPLIGFWSDNTKTRWGRRIPFMAIAGLPLCITFFMIWAPPLGLFPANSVSLFVYLCAIMGLFWFLYTAVLCPYLSLLPEIAVSSKDRVNLATYQSVTMLVSSGAAMVAAPLIVDHFGFIVMGALFGIMSLIGIYIPVLFIRERYVHAEEADGSGYGIMTALKWSFSNKPFVIYLVSNVFCNFGFNMIIASLVYIVPVILGLPTSFISIIMVGTGAVAVVSFIVIGKISDRVDKRKIYMAGMVMMIFLLPMIFVFGRFDLTFTMNIFGTAVTISELIPAFVVFTLTGVPLAIMLVLAPPLLSDVIDLDELNTGKRREAMYFGAQGFLQKLGVGLSAFTMGSLFSAFGYTRECHLGLDLLGPITGFFVLIGLIIFRWYPIDNKQSEEIRRKLDERHNGAAAAV